MSQENVEIVRRQSEAYARGDWEEAMSFLDPNVVYDISQYSAGGSEYHGLEGVREGFGEWIASWEDYRTEVLEVIDGGEDKVVAVTLQTGTGRASGAPVEVANAVVNTMRNGKVIRIDLYPTRAAALKAVGLSE